MQIEHYSFGNIVIGGKAYTKDVIIFPERVFSPWWRKDGHFLRMEDLSEALREKPEVLVIGTGNPGKMEVPDEVVKKLTDQGIRVIVGNTPEAVNTFNNLSGNKIAALHLTC